MDTNDAVGKMYRENVIYKMNKTKIMMKYTILEQINCDKFSVLHADIIDENYRKNYSYTSSLSGERVYESDLLKMQWATSIEEAVRAHDIQFDN